MNWFQKLNLWRWTNNWKMCLQVSILGLAVYGGVCCPASAMAQTSASYWSKIRAADTRANASQIVWRRIHTELPDLAMDVNKSVALEIEEWRQQGKSDKLIAQLADGQRQVLREAKKGLVQTSIISLVHKGNSTQAEVTIGSSHPFGAPDSAWTPSSIHVNFYDGTNAVTLDSPALQPGQSAKNVLFTGTLKRNITDIMPFVGGRNLSFLIASPLFTDYTPANSSLQEGVNDTVILEKHLQQHAGARVVPILMHWVISRQTWRPLLMEYRFDFVGTKDAAANQNTFQRVRFLDYHHYPGGVWWPSRIVDEEMHGASPDEKPGIIRDYYLQTAKFNEYVDPMLLQRPLPKGAQIGDYRFEARGVVSYVIDKGIPTDKEVLKLLESREATQKAEVHKSSALPVLPIGLLLIASGGVLWRRSHKDEENIS